MIIWNKGENIDTAIQQFTVGKDRELDVLLARYDVLGSMAHAIMLESIGILDKTELENLQKELKNIYSSIEKGQFSISDDSEDVHSRVEDLLTSKLGDTGKKIHSGRSRNDQVLLDMKLFAREGIQNIVKNTGQLFDLLVALSNQHKDVLMPGYTHFQVAMPSSFGLWFGAYAESLVDDLTLLQAAYQVVNQNPLGSAAGYGNSFPLNRQMTTDLLGFDSLNYNVVYAQMGRGKMEKTVSMAFASLASTLGKMAYDICLYMSQNFNFISFPGEITTGSSIMPHKKNPDVFELIRAKTNRVQALPFEIQAIAGNLPSGYHRDFQQIKESFLPVFDELNTILAIMAYSLDKIQVNKNILEDKKYDYLFSVEVVNEQVLEGIPFREAYVNIGKQIKEGRFKPTRKVSHTHEGSIGNLCNEEISKKMKNVMSGFHFEEVEKAYQNLLK